MAVTTKPPAAGPSAITGALAQITSRLRLQRWVRHASRGALAGTAPALTAVVLAHFDLLPDWLPLEAAIPVPILLGILAGTVTTFLRPISLMDAARLAEARLGLKERLSSALEFERSPQASDPEAATLRRLQMADAASHAQSLKSTDAVPIRLPWELKAFAAGLAVIALALWVPNLPVFVPPGVKIERQIVQKTGTKLEQTAKRIAKQADAQRLPETRRAAAQMQRLAQRLAAGRMDKKQAMVQMSKLTQQMRQQLQKTAQANSSAGAGGKSLAQAGQQLAQAMAGGQNAAGANGKQAGSGQQNGGSGSKSGQKSGQNAGASAKSGAGNKFNGFNVPTAGKSAAGKTGQNAQTPATPEMQKAAQAMQQNDSQALSEQLRQMADKIGSGTLSPAEQQQAAQDVQKLADALKNTPMPETQGHAQAAADALKRGDKQTAASEMRKAAASAEREAQEQADQQAQSDAAQGVEDAQSQMAGANSPGDISDDSGSQPGQGQGKGKGSGKGQGSGEGDGSGLGDGQNLQSSHGKEGSGKGNGGSGGGGMAGGKPGDNGEGSSPLKHLGKAGAAPNPKGVKLYFGKPLNAGPSKTGPTRKVGANPNALPGSTASQVPYYNYVAPARKSAESAMDKEDIPPAYRSDVRKYFDSLNPPATSGGTR